MPDRMTLIQSVPHIEQYTGGWVMQEAALLALEEKVRGMDIFAHVAHVAESKADFGAEVTDDNKAPLTIADGIATLELTGTLTKYGSSLSGGPAMAAVKRQVRSLGADDKIKGLMLKIDSGGGTVAGTEDLAAAIRAFAEKKPVLARIEDVGCSGAYWLALAADYISANATAVVGSIGVLGVMWDTSERSAKQGVETVVIKAGEFKGIGVPGAKITEAQRAELQRQVNEDYSIFVDTVARGRKISREAALELADARVHVGENAKKIGLVDAIESDTAAYGRMLQMVGNFNSNSKGKSGGTAGARGAPGPALTKEVAMSEPTPPLTPPAPAPEAQGPKAASLKELKAALPKSTAEFREQCQEKGLTLEQAKDAWIAHQDAALEKAQANAVPAGVKPLGGGTAKPAEASAVNGRAVIEAAAAEFRKNGMERSAAWARACRENEEARAAMVAEHNEKHQGGSLPK